VNREDFELASDVLTFIALFAFPIDLYLGLRWAEFHYRSGMPFFSRRGLVASLVSLPSEARLRAHGDASWFRPIVSHRFSPQAVGFRESFFFSSGWRGLVRWGEKAGEIEVSARLNYFPLIFVVLIVVRGLMMGEPIGTACAVAACLLYLMWQQVKLRRFARRLLEEAGTVSQELEKAG
jgi:hypothetical protein